MSREKIAILVPAADGAYGGTRWPDVLARMVAPLEAAGMEVAPVDWTTDADLTGFDLVLALLAWGYHRDGPAPDYWAHQVGRWQAAGVRLQNPPDVLRWNADKAYLGDFEAKGAPVVPTIFVEQVTEAAMHDAAARLGTERLIAKPRVSASAFRTIRWSPGTALDGAPTDAAMIQPFIADVLDGGEPSLLYLGGRFSHAVSKRPQPGDFRVQPEFGGIIAPYQPWPDELAAAEAALAAAGEPLLYARVDLVRDLKGRPVLMELEAVEPDLFLEYAPGAPARFAEAVGRAARG
jgi:glutathione synthase/RimK-type ligase-like ATP-grasp enzyme